MPKEKTHRLVNKPQIGIRYLAGYMNGSDRARRSIIRQCKFQKIARVIQHQEAKIIVSKFIKDNDFSLANLVSEAEKIKNRIADSEFEEELFAHNAEYLIRFGKIADDMTFPDAERLDPGPSLSVNLNGTRVVASLDLRTRRTTRTNKVRVGGCMLRYSKGKKVDATEAGWQSALIHGLLSFPENIEEGAEAEQKLCLTLDAYSGEIYSAPTDSVSRFKNAEAACATIADAWDNISPPPGAVY